MTDILNNAKKGLRDNTLVKSKLSSQKLTSDQLIDFYGILETNTSLTHLDLGHNQITHLNGLVDALKNGTVTHVNLSHNNIAGSYV